MIVKAIKITPETAIKTFEKHNALSGEIYEALNDKPKFKKVGGDQYLAIGKSSSRFITIFFSYNDKTKEAEINTAYPSDKNQIKSYKKMK